MQILRSELVADALAGGLGRDVNLEGFPFATRKPTLDTELMCGGDSEKLDQFTGPTVRHVTKKNLRDLKPGNIESWISLKYDLPNQGRQEVTKICKSPMQIKQELWQRQNKKSRCRTEADLLLKFELLKRLMASQQANGKK